MDIQTRQLIDRNRVGYFSSMVIMVAVLLMTALGFVGEITIPSIVRCVILLEAMVFTSIAHQKMKTSAKYVHICCSTMIVVYLVTLFTAKSINMYVIVFPIAIMVMVFANNQLTLLGCIVAMFGIVVFSVSLVVRHLTGVTEMIFAIIFSSVVCILAILVTRLQNRQYDESLQEVQEKADLQMETSRRIVQLANDLNTKFVSAKEVSETLNESMSTSHSSVNEIAESTKVNAHAIEQQTVQTSDIQMSIQKVGDEAKTMGEISARTSATVDEGVSLIYKLKEQAAQVADINNETKEITAQLNESIQGVQEITETILGISSQTNLLALNASIEAARAGEAGKGFAVVADEIRNLSEDTRVATEQISDIIGRLTQDAEHASSSMTRSAESAEKQSELILRTGEKLSDIKKDTDELYEGVNQVNTSVESIISATSRIMDSITNLSATGQQVAASSETALSISDTSLDALGDMNRLLENISEISSDMERVAKQ